MPAHRPGTISPCLTFGAMAPNVVLEDTVPPLWRPGITFNIILRIITGKCTVTFRHWQHVDTRLVYRHVVSVSPSPHTYFVSLCTQRANIGPPHYFTWRTVPNIPPPEPCILIPALATVPFTTKGSLVREYYDKWVTDTKKKWTLYLSRSLQKRKKKFYKL